MVIQPIYNILFLPDVTYHFKKEFFTENASEQLEVGSELLFAFLRNEDDAEELDADHICPVGISARVEAFGDDDSVQIRTLERVDLSDVEVENATARVCPSAKWLRNGISTNHTVNDPAQI